MPSGDLPPVGRIPSDDPSRPDEDYPRPHGGMEGETMESGWDVFRETGDPLAYLLYRAGTRD